MLLLSALGEGGGGYRRTAVACEDVSEFSQIGNKQRERERELWGYIGFSNWI